MPQTRAPRKENSVARQFSPLTETVGSDDHGQVRAHRGCRGRIDMEGRAAQKRGSNDTQNQPSFE